MTFEFGTPERLSREVALKQIVSPEPTDRMDALLSLALFDPDGPFAQTQCLASLRDPDRDVVATAVLGLAHIARLHRSLDLELVLLELEELRRDHALAGRVDDALDDIAVFVASAQEPGA